MPMSKWGILPRHMKHLSEFELHRYKKYSDIFIDLFKSNKTKAANYIQELELNEEQMRYVRFFNNVALGRKVNYDE